VTEPSRYGAHAIPLRGFAIVTLSYLAAAAAAWAALRSVPEAGPFAKLAIANVVGTLVVYAFSMRFDNSSFYDPYWSVAPAAGAVYLAFGPFEREGIAVRKWLAMAVVVAWGVRLTFNWARGWRGLSHEDWRYVDLRAKWKRLYFFISFVGIHFVPTTCTLLGSLPLLAIMRSERPLGVVDMVGFAIALAATAFEAVADRQMHAYRTERAERGERGGICEVGLWAYSRHPNYFGECMFWVGLFVASVGADPSAALLGAVGPVVMFLLFLFVSIPLAEARSAARRPGFEDHKRRVSMLVPWFRRR